MHAQTILTLDVLLANDYVLDYWHYRFSLAEKRKKKERKKQTNKQTKKKKK